MRTGLPSGSHPERVSRRLPPWPGPACVSQKTLVHGSRTLAGLYLRGYFSSVLDGRYMPCCSSETAQGVFPGRTTAWLASGDLPAAERYLLCGSSRMVVDARDVLISRGVPFSRVVAEIYF